MKPLQNQKHELILYEDSNGNSPVLEFLTEISSPVSKSDRIRLKKVQEYLNVLQTYGKSAGEPFIKHLDGDIWEIRPTSDRILFAGAMGNDFVLLHQFEKKTQKTPRREIEKAEKELKDFLERSEKK